MVSQSGTDDEPREVLVAPECLAVYVEAARAEYEQEEGRWRAAQDKAKTVFAIAALVGSLMFARMDWGLSHLSQSWHRSVWIATVVLGAAALLAALVIAATVFTPKPGWGLEPAEIALRKLANIPAYQAQQYLGEYYASTAKKNAHQNDSQLLCVRWATWLVIASLAVALGQLVFLLVTAEAA